MLGSQFRHSIITQPLDALPRSRPNISYNVCSSTFPIPYGHSITASYEQFLPIVHPLKWTTPPVLSWYCQTAPSLCTKEFTYILVSLWRKCLPSLYLTINFGSNIQDACTHRQEQPMPTSKVMLSGFAHPYVVLIGTFPVDYTWHDSVSALTHCKSL